MNEKDAERKLQNLGDRVRLGWKGTHQVSEKTKQAVRNAITEDWEKSKNQSTIASKDSSQERSLIKSKDQDKDESQTQY